MSATEPKLGVAIVAAGARGKAHADAWAALPDTEVRVVADVDDARARELAEAHTAEWTGDGLAAATRDDVDIVSVCTPAAYHATYVVPAAQAGKHVLCEKPMALSLDDADQMIAAARDNEVVLSFSFQGQFRESTAKVRELVAAGEIGRPIMIRQVHGAEIRPKLAMHDRLHGNNGPFVDTFCHSLTAWRTWLQSEPVCVKASGMTLARDAEELRGIAELAVDTGAALVEFASCDVGEFSASWGLPKGVRAGGLTQMLGPKGTMVPGRGSISITKRGGEETTVPNLATGNENIDQAKHFVACVRRECEPVNTGADARIALQVSLAALESMATGQTVRL